MSESFRVGDAVYVVSLAGTVAEVVEGDATVYKIDVGSGDAQIIVYGDEMRLMTEIEKQKAGF